MQSRARDVFVCTMAVTVESKHNLPFDSTHFIAWSRDGKSAPAAGCFHRSWTVASSAGVKTSRSHGGVSYRLDRCHLFGGMRQHSPQCQLHIPLLFSCTHLGFNVDVSSSTKSPHLFPIRSSISLLMPNKYALGKKKKKDVILGSLALFAQHILCALYGCTVFRQHCFLCSPN